MSAPDPTTGPAEPAAVDPARLRVLVVDDMQLMRDMAAAMLRAQGIGTVETCDDGAAALAALDRIAAAGLTCDLMLLDLNMPGMDGIEVLRHLAERGYEGQIALFSAESARVLRTAETLARAHNLNILGFVEKPLTDIAIAGLLRKLATGGARAVIDADEPLSEAELLDGIRLGQIEIMVQPKVAMATRQPVGVEALARWRHPQRGVIGAGQFIPLAENGAAAEPLFEAILGLALRAAAHWRAEGLSLQMAVNLSTANLTRLDLPQRIASAVSEHGLRPGDIVLEVTESRLIEDQTAALEVLTRLKLKGFNLAIDDFGTGYSSLEQLQRFPFEEMKIDRQFVGMAAQDQAARAIVSSSVRLARKLGMTTVAEGIETRLDWDCAAEQGCDVAQGYFVAPPLKPEALPGWIATWLSRRD
ncbi:MAG: EAL domain-containing response regulator [Ferrovibrio sp.]|uniref:EAL domain-containing response regulator n=1 Tax=Ferrovibrio sp. TaxID=1917215 RepID=UPI002608CCF1|nr:EAL domain-containing response regulator [Ferrovibrio sp.]MCW0234328.1 EAL domain-containing response regulator [Ferrovibrio sp.]